MSDLPHAMIHNEYAKEATQKFCINDFDYELPKQLIAFEPTKKRDHSRLLVVSKSNSELFDRKFVDISQYLCPGDLLVLNDTKVFPARLFGYKQSGGKVEILAERVLSDETIKVQLKSNRTPKIGSTLIINNELSAKIKDRQGEFFVLQFSQRGPALKVFEQYGHVPLPPYIAREERIEDRTRYQTVYAKNMGAVAAPTAGLHFTRELLDELKAQGVSVCAITLHVGAGTFKPVKVQDPSRHKMHSEYISISSQVCDKIMQVKSHGGRVIAVGTTCVRALESAALNGDLKSFAGDTDIFIYPGFKFNVVDALITNFHLPRSTLLMLVSAFGGHANIMRAYQHAVQNEYRFYSYGDAMLILN